MENTDNKQPKESGAEAEIREGPLEEEVVDFEALLSSDRVTPELKKQLGIVIEFALNPEAHRRLLDAQIPLTLNIGEVVKWVAGEVPTGLRFPDPKAKSEGRKEPKLLVDRTTAETIKAMQYFIAKAMLAPGADHYRVLGLKIQSSIEDIQNNYRYIRRVFSPSEGSEAAQACVMRISDAYVTLRDTQTRRQYNERLFGKQSNLYVSNVSVETEKTKREPAKKASGSEGKSRLPMFFSTLLVVACLAGLAYWSLLPDLPSQKNDRTVASISPPVDVLSEPQTPQQALKVEASIDEVIDTLQANDIDTTLLNQDEPDPVVLPDTEVTTVEIMPEVQVREPIDPVVPAVSEQQAKIQALLAQGDRHLKGSRLTQPSGENAFENFRAVLSLDPRNVQARDGLEKIAARYVNLARFRMSSDRYEEANLMVNRGLLVLPSYPPLLRLEAEIVEQLSLIESQVSVAQSAPKPEPEPAPVIESAPVVMIEPEPETKPEIIVEVAPTPVAPLDVPAIEPVSPAVVIVPPSETAVSDAIVYLDEQGKVSEAVLASMIDTFITTYERGDLDSFLTLFSESAHTNNRNSKKEIRADYEALFSTTKSRLMRLRDIRWKRTAENAVGDADFRLTVFRAGNSRPKTFEGSLTFQIILVDGELLINGLFHSQDRVKR